MTADRWVMDGALVLRWDSEALVAEVPPAGKRFALVPEFVPLLGLFAKPVEQEAAIAAFLGRYEGGDARSALTEPVRELVGELQAARLLVPEGQETGLTGGQFATAEMHLHLLNDYVRTATYGESIRKRAAGGVVLEIGCGSGLLSCVAARAGAQHVYAIERAEIIEVARRIAHDNGLADQITFIAGDSMTVELPEQADLIVSELMSIDPLMQQILPILRDAGSRFLAPGGAMIPARLSILAVALDSDRVRCREYLLQESLRSARHLGAAYGFDLSSLADAYEQEVVRSRARSTMSEDLGAWKAGADLSHTKILSDEVPVIELDLASLDPADAFEIPVTLDIERSGRHNAVATYFNAAMDDDLLLTSSPFGPQRCSAWSQLLTPIDELEVVAGDQIRLNVTFDQHAVPTISYSRP